MKVETLKKKIVKKFGSVNRFCNIAGKNYQNINNLFRLTDGPLKQSKLKELDAVVRKTKKDAVVEGLEVSDDLLKRIRVAILTDHKNFLEFCKAKKVSNTWLSALLNGKHRLLSKRVLNLCETLNVPVEKWQD